MRWFTAPWKGLRIWVFPTWRISSEVVYGKSITELDQANAATLIESLRDGNVSGWNGPPPPLVYHFLRNDAVDVVYGTMEGFADLGIPYLAHIEPPRAW